VKKVEVITQPRTMSGFRGGMRIALDECSAKEWIEKRWADPVDTPKPEKRKSQANDEL